MRRRPASRPVPTVPAGPPAADVPVPRRRLVYAALVVLALVAYANAFGGAFVLDSQVIVLEDPRLREVSAQNLGLIVNRSYWWPYDTIDDLYRPVTTLSYLVNYAVLGHADRPAGYHAVNVLLHAANVLLAFGVAWRIGRRFWPAVVLAAVWAVHPLATEAVTNIVGRADLLAGLGVLGGVLAWLLAAESTGRARTRWLATACVAVTVGVFSKESAVAVVGVVVLYDLMLRTPRPPLRALVPGWMVMAAPVLLLLLQRALVLGVRPMGGTLAVDNPIAGAGFWSGTLTALAVLPRYVWLTAFPLTLSADYSYGQIPLVSGALVDWIAWAALVALVAAAVVAGRRRPTVGFAAGAAFLLVLPASNLLVTTGTIMAERLAYLPMIGTLACLGVAIRAGANRLRVPDRALVAATAVLVVGLTARTWLRNGDWASDIAIWSATVEASPRSFKAHQGLADALYEADQTRSNLDRVVMHASRAAGILDGLPAADRVSATYRRAAAYAIEYGDQVERRGGEGADTARAEAFEAAVRFAATHVEVLEATRGAAAIAAGGNSEASRETADAYRLLATARSRLASGTDATAPGAEALVAAERARQLEPTNPMSFRTTATAMVAARRYDEAAATFIAGFMVTGDASLRESVLDLYRSGLDPQGCATITTPNGPSLNPACEPVRRHLCLASRDVVRMQRAGGRADLAASVQTAALETYGCPASFFAPPAP